MNKDDITVLVELAMKWRMRCEKRKTAHRFVGDREEVEQLDHDIKQIDEVVARVEKEAA